jgi:ribosome-binding ATPase YchF (GTP1/OBG family)
MQVVVGCVGKPSAGKSTFFTAVCEKAAKMGAFPFTTIEPNIGVTYYKTPCPCRSRGKTMECSPRYGRCEEGQRFIPIRLLDVAGLVPGASDGLGLGNKFLNDLRGADVLLHVLDASGTTNEKGEATTGYDPAKDHEWLVSEIQKWIHGNLWPRWPGIARKHAAQKATAAASLGPQFTGYSCKPSIVVRVLEKLGIHDPVDLSLWGEDEVRRLCNAFVELRFPMIILLNKADHPDAAGNIQRIVEGRDPSRCIVSSAMAECFLKQCKQKGWISYTPGSSSFMTRSDAEDEADFLQSRGEPVPSDVKASLALPSLPDKKTAKRLERIKDLMLFRYGSTGVWDAVQRAVEEMRPVIAYPVRNLKSFATEEGAGLNAAPKAVFADAVVLPQGSTVLDLAHKIGGWLEGCLNYAEAEDGRRIAEDAPLEGLQVIVRFVISQAKQQQQQSKQQKATGGGSAEAKTRTSAGATAAGGVVL